MGAGWLPACASAAKQPHHCAEGDAAERHASLTKGSRDRQAEAPCQLYVSFFNPRMIAPGLIRAGPMRATRMIGASS